MAPGNGAQVTDSDDDLQVYITYQSNGGGYQTPTWAYKIDSGFPAYGSPHGGTQVVGSTSVNDIFSGSEIDQTQSVNPTNAASSAGQIFTAGVSGKLSKVLLTIWPQSGAKNKHSCFLGK